MFKAKKAQSTLEYIIIFSVIVVAVFVLAYGALKPTMKNLVMDAGGEMEKAVSERFIPFGWSNSGRAPTPPPTDNTPEDTPHEDTPDD